MKNIPWFFCSPSPWESPRGVCEFPLCRTRTPAGGLFCRTGSVVCRAPYRRGCWSRCRGRRVGVSSGPVLCCEVRGAFHSTTPGKRGTIWQMWTHFHDKCHREQRCIAVLGADWQYWSEPQCHPVLLCVHRTFSFSLWKWDFSKSNVTTCTMFKQTSSGRQWFQRIPGWSRGSDVFCTSSCTGGIHICPLCPNRLECTLSRSYVCMGARLGRCKCLDRCSTWTAPWRFAKTFFFLLNKGLKLFYEENCDEQIEMNNRST